MALNLTVPLIVTPKDEVLHLPPDQLLANFVWMLDIANRIEHLNCLQEEESFQRLIKLDIERMLTRYTTRIPPTPSFEESQRRVV